MVRRLAAVAFAFTALGFAQPQPVSFDILIRNGRVMDGSGNPWIRTDIGITGDRIAAMGRLEGAAAGRIVDAHDLVVAPGFIDVHSHAGEGLGNPALREAQPIVAQGVTTVAINPDGGGPVNLAEQRAMFERGGIGLNVAPLIGHGSVRAAVMGQANRAPTPAELDRMTALVTQALRDGAFGLSSGLFYVPGSFAKTEEVIALARAVAPFGGVYTSHIRDEADYGIGVEAAVKEVIRIAEEAGVRGIVTHMKALGRDNWGKSASLLKDIDDARSRGVEVFADQYPYEASSTSLRAALAPNGIQPTEPAVTDNLRRRGGPASIMIAFCRRDPSIDGKTLADIAAARQVSPVQAAIDIINGGDASIVSFNMSEADIEAIMRAPYTMASSDGALVPVGAGHPHPRDYGAFARRLAVYVRERKVVSLEFAIRSMTSLPAAVFGIRDRGVVRPGAFADVAIFDPATIADEATYTDPQRLATGVPTVIVNGVIVRDGGKFTGALPGRVLRRDGSR
ncbi:MAG TPA: D-aminoacylase [Vicinamibacterales bacterium]|jgi:N-acyl-D-amino-acid deacylase|nr:D-aminoacylase [Vicinamibacterales bacterium]